MTRTMPVPTRRRFALRLLAALAAALAPFVATPPAARAQPQREAGSSITLASTTSTEQSGLFGHILPLFTRQTGIAVRVVALGTGQALDVARRGDADAVLVHDAAAEQRFVAEGHGIDRRAVMYNDFVLIGPAADPAGIAGMRDAAAAMRRIAEARSPFISRGDRSGTHTAELALWRAVGLDPAAAVRAAGGGWYRAIGQGMGPALNAAAAQDAYVLSDRGTWLSFRNRRTLRILVEGDPRLRNPYSVILVNPARHPHVRQAEARAFADWLVSPEGQRGIADYRIGGEQLFFPDAAAPASRGAAARTE